MYTKPINTYKHYGVKLIRNIYGCPVVIYFSKYLFYYSEIIYFQ